MEDSINQSVRNNLKNWWLLLISGILLVALGILVFAAPAASYLSLSIFFSVSLVITGITEIAFAVSHRQEVQGWVWNFIGGLIDLTLGMYLLANPAVTMATLPFLLGLWLLFRGLLAIGTSFNLRAQGLPNWGWLLAIGIGIVLLAVLIFSNPALGVINIIIWTGLAFITAGAFRIYLSLRLRRLKNRLHL